MKDSVASSTHQYFIWLLLKDEAGLMSTRDFPDSAAVLANYFLDVCEVTYVLHVLRASPW